MQTGLRRLLVYVEAHLGDMALVYLEYLEVQLVQIDVLMLVGHVSYDGEQESGEGIGVVVVEVRAALRGVPRGTG